MRWRRRKRAVMLEADYWSPVNRFQPIGGQHGDGKASGDDRDHAGAGADSGAEAVADSFAGACEGTVPVVGWKALSVTDVGQLSSPATHHLWPSYQRVEAHCNATWHPLYFANPGHQHGPPEPLCNCGVHLGLRIDHAWPYAGDQPALARIHGWGRVVANEAGYRVQYAYPESIILVGRPNNNELRWLASRVEVRYGVPVEILSRKRILDMAAAEAASA